METILTTVAIVLTGVFAAVVITIIVFGRSILSVIVPIIARGMAEGKFFGRKNFGFTMVKEGQAKVILAFGKFERVILVYDGFGLDQFWNVRNKKEDGLTRQRWDESQEAWVDYIVSIRPIEEGGQHYTYFQEIDGNGNGCKPKDEGNHPGRFPSWMPKFITRHLPGGAWWVGNPFTKEVHSYNFQWTTLRQKQIGGELSDEFYFQDMSDTSPAGPIDYINVLDDLYVARILGCETSDPIPVDVLYILTIRITNPYKALFRVEQWLEGTLNRTMTAVRAWVSTKSYVDAIKKAETTVRLEDEILKHTQIADYIERHWGARVKALSIKNIDPNNPKLRDATTAQYTGQMAGKGIAAKAEGEAAAVRSVATAVAQSEMGQLVLAARALEKMSEGPATVIHGNQLSTLLLNVGAGKKANTADTKPEDDKEGGNQ